MRAIDADIRREIIPWGRKALVNVDISVDAKNVAFLATVVCDSMGGHSRLIQNGIDLLRDEYDCRLFLTNLSETNKSAPELLRTVRHEGITADIPTSEKEVVRLAKAIIRFGPKILFVFIHPEDYWGAAVVALMREYSHVKVVVSDHASHYPIVGATMADVMSTAFCMTGYINTHYRKAGDKNIVDLRALTGRRLSDCKVFSDDDRVSRRTALGLNADDFCMMSGAASYKFFDVNGTSEYFEMIRRLLERFPQVKHFVLSSFAEKERAIIERVFVGSDSRSRLFLLPFSPEYESYFNACDLFVDSFPVSSAMTMVDLMRLKVPYVVKINKENPLWSFHEYQRGDFPYMYDTVPNMEDVICQLIAHPSLRWSMVESNFKHYLQNFEGNQCRQFLVELIQHADCLDEMTTRSAPLGTYLLPL